MVQNIAADTNLKEKASMSTMGETMNREMENIKDNASRVSDDVRAYVSDQMENLSHRLEDLSQQMRDRAGQLDVHVRHNPYYYILGAVGLGFLLAKATSSSTRIVRD
jgi:ElaB/YqjD/DUF883 family membrane-anchored ribosome-binding protein